MATAKDLLTEFNKLSKAEQEAFTRMLTSKTTTAATITDLVAKERFVNGYVCPLCGSIHVVRNGRRKDGKQRYMCRDCMKSFVATVHSVASGTRKDLDTWTKYINCMMNGMSLRKSAKVCEIHRNTAFMWRHKILDVLQNMAASVSLNGIIEADETFFNVSFKGNHKQNKSFSIPRKARKRGEDVHVRGVSYEKVCVPCAVDRNGHSISKITNLGRVSTKALHSVFDDRFDEKSILCTDRMNSYVRFANKNTLNLVQLKGGKEKKGIYNIQRINAYHGELKLFMRPFKGVSTKYLNNYLIWHNFVNYAKETVNEKRNILLNFALTTPCSDKCRTMSYRNPVPLAV